MEALLHKYKKYKYKYLELYKKKVFAICILKSENITGEIFFDEIDKNKVKIYGKISGLKINSKHAIHIHEYGDLRENCNACCNHYNPFNKEHGDRLDEIRHAGDLGNIQTNELGIGEFSFEDKLVKLKGPYSVIGRSIIIHEDEDDLGMGGHHDSKKTGHAGKRLICGVIGLRKEEINKV